MIIGAVYGYWLYSRMFLHNFGSVFQFACPPLLATGDAVKVIQYIQYTIHTIHTYIHTFYIYNTYKLYIHHMTASHDYMYI